MHSYRSSASAFPEASLADAFCHVSAGSAPRERFLEAVREFVDRRLASGADASTAFRTLSELLDGTRRHLARSGATRETLQRATKLSSDGMMEAVAHHFRAGLREEFGTEHHAAPLG